VPAGLGFERAQIRLDSVPPGADVKDLSIGAVIGRTPLTFTVPASRAPRQFAVHHKDYVDAVVELVPDREVIDDTEKLRRGSSTSPPVVHRPAPPARPEAAAPSPPVTPPPDPAAAPAAPPKSPDDDCGDPPCLKQDPSRTVGAGSAS
jgi:hypothetical protein